MDKWTKKVKDKIINIRKNKINVSDAFDLNATSDVFPAKGVSFSINFVHLGPRLMTFC